MSRTIAVLAAMKDEIRAVAELESKRLLRIETQTHVMGIGKVNAAIAAMECAPWAAQFIVIGTAGGIGNGIQRGDVVISRDTVFHDVDAAALGFPVGHVPYEKANAWRADEMLVSIAARAALQEGSAPKVGRMLTGDRFVADPAEAKRLAEQHKGLSVDWETAAVALVAAKKKIPWISIRVVSDLAGQGAGKDFSENLRSASDKLGRIIERMDQIL